MPLTSLPRATPHATPPMTLPCATMPTTHPPTSHPQPITQVFYSLVNVQRLTNHWRDALGVKF